MITLCILLIYTFLSIGWFVLSLGRYYEKDRWYDYVLSPPMIIIAWVATVISTIFGWNK